MNPKTMKQFNTLNADVLATVEGGVGYTWACLDGKSSHWHLFRSTAKRQYESIYEHFRCNLCHFPCLIASFWLSLFGVLGYQIGKVY